MKIFVTGATGFIGIHLCRQLVKSGHDVVALVRNPRKAAALPKEVEYLEGDLSLFKDEQLVLPACDLVIHLAGIVTAKSLKDYHVVNYLGVRNLVECLKRQSWRPKRFLFASSLAVAGPTHAKRPMSESDPENPIDAYGQSKLDAELYLYTAPFPVTLFRPGAVFGPGDPAFLTIFKMAAWGFGFRVGGNNQAFSYIYVDDLIAAIMKMTEDVRSEHHTYYVVYKTHTNTQTLWKTLSQVLQKDVLVVPVPKPILFCLMLGGTVFSKILPFKNQLDIKQYRQLVAPAFLCSSQALQEDLAWEPKHNLRETFKKTVAGYKAAGWL